MACVLSSSLFTRVLVIICIIRGFMAGVDTSKYIYHENFTFDCDNYYVSETLQKRSCTIDTSLYEDFKCILKGKEVNQLFFARNKNEDDVGLCHVTSPEKKEKCEKVTPGQNQIDCEDNGKLRTFTCYFELTKEFLGKQIFCFATCRVNINGIAHDYFVTNSTCPLYDGVPTLEPPTTAAPTTTAAPPEKEFPIWAAVVIALGIGGLIALLLFLVWRKRRQAQGLAQDAEGQNTGNPEGEEAEGGDNDAEEEEATNAESAEKSEDAEGGEEAPEEQ